MTKGCDQTGTNPANLRRPGMAHRLGAGRAATTDQRILEELRQVGRELLEQPVPQRLLDLARAAQERRD